MTGKGSQLFLAYTAMTLVSLVVAVLLLGYLNATGSLASLAFQVAATVLLFAGLFIGLKAWYDRGERIRRSATALGEQVETLQEEFERLQLENQQLRLEVDSLSHLRRNLARVVARQFAQEIVGQAQGNVHALNTLYSDTRSYLPIQFRNQGEEWLEVLERELESETIVEARRVPQLARWSPSADPSDAGPVASAAVIEDHAEPTGARTLKILLLAANPSDTTRLRLDEEVRTIKEVLRQTPHYGRIDLEQEWAVRVGDLQGLLLRHQPAIVHFGGHGSEASEIILEDSSGNSRAVPPEALASLFATLKDNLRCVVLNACYSENQARAIAEHIDCVVGMSDEIGDEAAISFAAAFYQAVGYGRDVWTAFELGRGQINLQGLPDTAVPKLWALIADPLSVTFVENG